MTKNNTDFSSIYSNDGKIEWANSEIAPGNSMIRLASIKVGTNNHYSGNVDIDKEFSDKIKCELIESMIEINTNICSNIEEVEKDIKKTLNHLGGLLKNCGIG